MPKPKTIIGPDRKEYSCLFVRVYGIPVWIPVGKEKEFRRKCKLSNRLTRSAEKANRQLQKVKELAAEIEAL